MCKLHILSKVYRKGNKSDKATRSNVDISVYSEKTEYQTTGGRIIKPFRKNRTILIVLTRLVGWVLRHCITIYAIERR